MSRGARWSRGARALTLASLGGVALLPLLPQLSALLPGVGAVERALAPWFALHCELDASRTPSLAGLPLAVCARCAGIYFGFGLGVLLRRPRLSTSAVRYGVCAAALVMIADVLLEQGGWHPPWAGLRLATGMLLAYPVGVGLGALIARAPRRDQSP